MGDTLKTGTVNYEANYSPDPLIINTSLSIKNETVKVTVNNVPNLKVTLKPIYDWNPIDAILTSIASLANIFQPMISKEVVSQVKDISIDIYTIPDVSIDPEGVQLKLSPSKIKLENEQGLLMVSGDIHIS